MLEPGKIMFLVAQVRCLHHGASIGRGWDLQTSLQYRQYLIFWDVGSEGRDLGQKLPDLGSSASCSEQRSE